LEVELAKGEFSKIDLNDIIKSIIEVAESTTLKKYGININLRTKDEEIIILGIGDKIAQVFHNLIDNALSFSKEGDDINISMWMGSKSATIEIKDSGPGIPKESLLKVFDRFYTYRPNDKTFGNNSGLGLSICKQIVETHSGSIIAGNKENGGAIFTVTLPLVKK
jgi:two-component system sensor histidine kinase ChvG